MLRPVIGEILGAWAPEYVEVTLLDAVRYTASDPVAAAMQGNKSLLGSSRLQSPQSRACHEPKSEGNLLICDSVF